MDDSVVGVVRGSEPIEFGSIIASKYTVLRPELGGSPGMFVCREAGLDPLRSAWVMHPRHTVDPEGEQFLTDLRKIAKLEHPQLRRVLDFGREPSGVLYAVYEPLELRNLADVVEQDWPLADERIVWLTCQLLAALEVAHAAGVTHGDLRPENVLVRAAGAVSQNEEILLCGLGLASAARYTIANRESRPHLQLTEWMVGMPPYAAPEQFRGEPRDARSDVYAAGLLLFQLLTRTAPFFATNDLDTAWMQCFTPPPPPSGYGQVSPALEAVCLKALTKTPDVRYQSANEMRAALFEAQAHRPSRNRVRLSRTSTPPSTPAPMPGSSRKSSPSIVPVVVVASRPSDAGSTSTRVSMTRSETIEMPAVREAPEPRFRKPSAALLLFSSTLAIAAAIVLPDLRFRDRDAETIVRAEPGDGRELAAPAELPPIALPVRARPSAVVAAPLAAATPAPAANSGKPLAPLTAAKPVKPVAQPLPAATPVAAVRKPEPARVRVRTIEKTVVAAEASVAEGATTHLEVSVVSAPEANAPAHPDAQLIELEKVAEPAAPAEQPVAAAPVVIPVTAPSVATAPAADSLPRAVVFTNMATKAPVPSSTPRDVSVSIGDATASSHGAVSKSAMRGAFNQAALARCYRDAVQSGEQPVRNASAELEFSTNMAGRVTAARVSGAGLTDGVARCLEEAARLGRVREADTGELRATVSLSFVVR